MEERKSKGIIWRGKNIYWLLKRLFWLKSFNSNTKFNKIILYILLIALKYKI
jgi:hypothetical protein